MAGAGCLGVIAVAFVLFRLMGASDLMITAMGIGVLLRTVKRLVDWLRGERSIEKPGELGSNYQKWAIGVVAVVLPAVMPNSVYESAAPVGALFGQILGLQLLDLVLLKLHAHLVNRSLDG
jgi:hypothetical protein